ncbi:MAG: PspC domain-containing protein [Bacillota bacterium]
MRRLYRSRRDRVIAGVCGGIADYLRIDVVLVRLLWVVLALAGGSGILAYIAALFIVPEEPRDYDPR